MYNAQGASDVKQLTLTPPFHNFWYAVARTNSEKEPVMSQKYNCMNEQGMAHNAVMSMPLKFNQLKWPLTLPHRIQSVQRLCWESPSRLFIGLKDIVTKPFGKALFGATASHTISTEHKQLLSVSDGDFTFNITFNITGQNFATLSPVCVGDKMHSAVLFLSKINSLSSCEERRCLV